MAVNRFILHTILFPLNSKTKKLRRYSNEKLFLRRKCKFGIKIKKTFLLKIILF